MNNGDHAAYRTRQSEIYANAMNYLAAALPAFAASSGGFNGGSPPPFSAPLLYGPNNKPLIPDSGYSIRKTAAKRAGSMKQWIPQRLFSRQQEAYERERIVERSTDLVSNDPHAAGIVDMFATTIVGPGLVPHPLLDGEATGLAKQERRSIQAQQRAIYGAWYPFADAGLRMTFGENQFLVQRNLVQYGEYLVPIHMIDDPIRPYALACRVINPLRLKTPIDKITGFGIHDGIELGDNGEPLYYWIKRSSPTTSFSQLPDTSANFLRMPARTGHRWNVLHGFLSQDAEQIRGLPGLTASMKFFRDLNDYLDAELVSNIVTAALAYFIEVIPGADPFNIAQNMASITDTEYKSDGTPVARRYEQVTPGAVMYGNVGEKPNLLSANRPGATFDPFTKIIKKALAAGLGIPYAIAFKDGEGVSFAGWRGLMLEAWRVFSHRRQWLGEGYCQTIYTMLMEEAYLKGDLTVKKFYTMIAPLTRAEWRGYPKGDIEPFKAAQADILRIQRNLKTRSRAIAEDGGDLLTTFDQLQEEQEMMADRGLTEEKITVPADTPAPDTDAQPDGSEKLIQGGGA